jgi:hypothetical protein
MHTIELHGTKFHNQAIRLIHKIWSLYNLPTSTNSQCNFFMVYEIKVKIIIINILNLARLYGRDVSQ